MFKNLKAELARKGLSANNEIAKILGCTDRSASNKLNGKTALTVREAEAIKNSLFPHLTLDYLFATDEMAGPQLVNKL